MSKFASSILTVLLLIAIGYFISQYFSTPEIKEEIITKTKIVNVGYDSSYVAALEANNANLSELVKSLHRKNREILARLKRAKSQNTRAVIDTFFVHDTTYIVASSPFRIGTDTLNCTGIVSFDMKRFAFSDVNFQYPQRTKIITKIVVEKKINWIFSAIAAIGGIYVGYQLGR